MGQLCSIFLKTCCWPPWVCCNPGKIVARLSLQPPEPSYDLEMGPDEKLRLVQDDKWGQHAALRNTEITLGKSRRGNRIVCAYISCVPMRDRVILVSHGNGEDLGTELGPLYILGKSVGWNVMVYDYSGYGRSGGEPCEANLYADIEAAFQVLRCRYGVSEERVVLLGRSIGSVPSISLACKTRVAGLVLLCPLASGFRTVCPGLSKDLPCDPYRNIARIPTVTAPVLLVHGTDDRLISPDQGQALLQVCPSAVRPLWVEGVGHNDLQLQHFLPRLRQFLSQELRAKSSNDANKPLETINGQPHFNPSVTL